MYTESDYQLLSELKGIDSALLEQTNYPAARLALQNRKIRTIINSLIRVDSSEFSNCLILPSILEGKYKTISYYGKRQTLAQVIYYFTKSEGDTVEFYMPEGNLYRECGNSECLNPKHLIIGKKNLAVQQTKCIKVTKKEFRELSKESKELERMDKELAKKAEEKKELTDEELEEESNRIMQELAEETREKEKESAKELPELNW